MCVKRCRNSVGPWNKSTASWLMYKKAVRFWTSTNSAGCMVFLFAECSRTPPYLFKMTSLIWCSWLQVSELCFGSLSVQPHLLAMCRKAAPSWARTPRQKTLRVHSLRSLQQSEHLLHFLPLKQAFGLETAFMPDPKKLLQEWAKVSVKEPRVWMCLLYWLQRLDRKRGSCSYMLTEPFRAGKRWARTQQLQAAGTTGPDRRQRIAGNSTLCGHDGKWSVGSMAWLPVCSAFARLSECLTGCCHCCRADTGVSGTASPPRRYQALIGTAVDSPSSRRSCKSISPGFPLHDLVSALPLIPGMPIHSFCLCCCITLSWITSYQVI